MKLTFKNGLHNCDRYLDSSWYRDEVGIVETICFCTKCGRIKDHWAYGSDCVIKYKPRDYTIITKSTKKEALPF